MTTHRTARVLAALSAFGFFVGAGLHTSGYRGVVLLAQQGPSGLAALVSALWLAFTAGMVVLGIIIMLVALGRVSGARGVLLTAAGFPLATAALQLKFLGFIPPVAILSTIGALSIAAAIMWPKVREPAPAVVGAA
jgi:hypothetical protein